MVSHAPKSMMPSFLSSLIIKQDEEEERQVKA